MAIYSFVHFAGMLNVKFAYINNEGDLFLPVQIFAILLSFAKIAKIKYPRKYVTSY